MSFLRVGDAFAYDPRTLHPLEYDEADERSVDELAGFSVRLATQSGAHEHEDTDRRVTRAMALALANHNPSRLSMLMTKLVAAGVWEADGKGWRLKNDTGYLHLLTQDEKDRQRARGADERNPMLTVPAKLRDGDNCRYCNSPVNWSDRKSLRGATWEHVDINIQPTPLHLFVVCCFGCNRTPSERAPLRPPPAKPKHGPATKKFVREHLGEFPGPARIAELYPGLRPSSGNATDRQRSETENAVPDQRSDSANATAGQRSDVDPATEKSRQRPANTAGNATAPPLSGGPPEGHKPSSGGNFDGSVSSRTDTGSHGSGFAGSGRVGKSLSGSPLDSPGLDSSPPVVPAASKRSRRGGKAGR